MSLFIPKRLIIKPQSRFSAKTKEILERTQRYNPNVDVEYLPKPTFKYPVTKPRAKFVYMKESAIISERGESFIRTFDSPGHIVEQLTTVINLSWMCAYRCEYCYLQTNQTPEHYFYTNFNVAENEIASSGPGHTAILTLWTHLSNYFNERLNKLPDRFKETSDWMREEFVKGRMTSDAEVIDRYFLMQDKIIKMLNKQNKTYKIEAENFRCSRDLIKKWYEANKAYPLTLVTSEFCDLFAVDHLTGNSNFLMKMVEKFPPIKYTVRTKSAYVDEILNYDGCDRVKIQIVLNTDDVIQQYEHGTATLDERINAARKVQEATGFQLGIVFEPMIIHDDYTNDYSQLMRRLFKELDPKKIQTITLGSLRFSSQLMASVKMHYPKTTLLDKNQQLTPPIYPDTKHRYPIPVRRSLYSKLISIVCSHGTIPVKLGTEEPTMWDALGLNKRLELDGVVYENIQKESPTMKKTQKQSKEKKSAPAKKVSAKPVQKNISHPPPLIADEMDGTYKPNWNAIAPQNYDVTIELLQKLDDGIPLEDLEKGMKILEQMSMTRVDNKGNMWSEYYWDTIESSTFQSIIQGNNIFKPVKVIGNISNISPIYPFNFGDDNRGFVAFGLTDTKGYKIETQLIEASNIFLSLDKVQGYRGRATFYGMVVPYYSGSKKMIYNRSYRFFLHDFILSASDLNTLTWTPSKEYDGTFRLTDSKGIIHGVPINHPTVIIKNHSKANGIIAYIKNELAKNLKIVALEDAKELDRALEFVILQALSQGYGEVLQKLHMLVIGSPTTGKSYLTKAALALNVVGQEITSSKMKISAAGLIGTVKQKSQKNISVPGILPNNSGGVVCIQEFHEILGEKRREVCGIFLRLMEEGKVIDSTSGNTLHIAETALLIDQNRYSDLYPDHKYDTYSDFDIPVPVLARFDHIILMLSDSNRAKSVANEMVDTFDIIDYADLNENHWSDNLKYLVAFLKHEYRNVKIPQAVREKLKAEFNNAINVLPNVKELDHLIDNMRVRMMRSVIKIARAVATANAVNIVTEAHIDYAMKFVQDKLDFLKSIHIEDIRKIKPSVNNIDARHDLLKQNFFGKTFSTTDADKFISENMEGTINEKTISRDLNKIGALLIGKKKGLWALGLSAGQMPKTTEKQATKHASKKSQSLKGKKRNK